MYLFICLGSEVMNKENIKVLISKEELHERIKILAQQISNDYKGRDLVIISILKGGAYFAIDLSKEITECDVIMDFMKVSSYGNAMVSSGDVKFILDLSVDIKDRDVLIVEDIIDSGRTLAFLSEYLKKKEPSSLKICTLLDKKERREIDVSVDYCGFLIEDKFVLGYGLDYFDKFRNLDYIAYVEEEK